MSRFVTSAEEYATAEAYGKRLKVIADCPNPEFNGYTIQECLDCGISNPFAPKYSMIGEIDTGERDIELISLEDLCD